MVHRNEKQNKWTNKKNRTKKQKQTSAQIYINNTWGYNKNVRYEQSRKSLQHYIRDTRLYIVQIGFPDFIELVCF